MSRRLKSRGRVSGSGTRSNDDGTVVAHRCENVVVSTTPNGNFRIEDPHGEFCIESLDPKSLKGLGWIKEPCVSNIQGTPRKSPNGGWNVTFEGWFTSDNDVRLDSIDAPCFWLEVENLTLSE